MQVGLFLDQQFDMQAVGGAELPSAIPTIGGYFDYGAADLTGPQLRLAASAGQGEMDLLRSDILDNTEAGMGEADVSCYGVLAKVGYGATLGSGWVATPYAAFRHTAVERKVHAEVAGDTVTKPVRYDAVTMAQTTAVLGARLNGKLDDKVSSSWRRGSSMTSAAVSTSSAGPRTSPTLKAFR